MHQMQSSQIFQHFFFYNLSPSLIHRTLLTLLDQVLLLVYFIVSLLILSTILVDFKCELLAEWFGETQQLSILQRGYTP